MELSAMVPAVNQPAATRLSATEMPAIEAGESQLPTVQPEMRRGRPSTVSATVRPAVLRWCPIQLAAFILSCPARPGRVILPASPDRRAAGSRAALIPPARPLSHRAGWVKRYAFG